MEGLPFTCLCVYSTPTYTTVFQLTILFMNTDVLKYLQLPHFFTLQSKHRSMDPIYCCKWESLKSVVQNQRTKKEQRLQKIFLLDL